MFYRIHQFIQALSAKIEPKEITWALSHLSPEACALFLKQSKSEQRHALDVAQSLSKEKAALTHASFRHLIVAALLHDCGKSEVSSHLWQRVFIVLMQKMPPSVWSRLERSHTVFATPLITATQHANWGSHLAKDAGLDPVICRLIHEHHNPQTALGKILERADNKH